MLHWKSQIINNIGQKIFAKWTARMEGGNIYLNESNIKIELSLFKNTKLEFDLFSLISF